MWRSDFSVITQTVYLQVIYRQNVCLLLVFQTFNLKLWNFCFCFLTIYMTIIFIFSVIHRRSPMIGSLPWSTLSSILIGWGTGRLVDAIWLFRTQTLHNFVLFCNIFWSFTMSYDFTNLWWLLIVSGRERKTFDFVHFVNFCSYFLDKLCNCFYFLSFEWLLRYATMATSYCLYNWEQLISIRKFK